MANVLRAVSSLTESLVVDGGHNFVVKYFKSQIVVFLMTICRKIRARLE